MANDLETLFILRDMDHIQASKCSERSLQDWVKTVWDYEDNTSPELLYLFVHVFALTVKGTSQHLYRS